MTEFEIKNIIEKQKKFFSTGKTLDVKFRIGALKKLKVHPRICSFYKNIILHIRGDFNWILIR